jgi:hypothetical protein
LMFMYLNPADTFIEQFFFTFIQLIYKYIHPSKIGVKHLREKEKGEANVSYSFLVLLLV